MCRGAAVVDAHQIRCRMLCPTTAPHWISLPDLPNTESSAVIFKKPKLSSPIVSRSLIFRRASVMDRSCTSHIVTEVTPQWCIVRSLYQLPHNRIR